MIRKTLTIPTGTSQIEVDYVYQGKLPDVVILAMVSDTDMSGGSMQTHFTFKILGQTTFAFRLMVSNYTGWLISQILPIKTI